MKSQSSFILKGLVAMTLTSHSLSGPFSAMSMSAAVPSLTMSSQLMCEAKLRYLFWMIFTPPSRISAQSPHTQHNQTTTVVVKASPDTPVTHYTFPSAVQHRCSPTVGPPDQTVTLWVAPSCVGAGSSNCSVTSCLTQILSTPTHCLHMCCCMDEAQTDTRRNRQHSLLSA